MATPTQHFNLPSPGPTTPANKLGAELLAFSQAIDTTLKSFDYNGADPALVAARVAALEAWKANIGPRVAALETVATITKANIVSNPGTTVADATKLRKTGDGYVSGYLLLSRTSDFEAGGIVATLPLGWRPPDVREFVAYISQGGAAQPVLLQVRGDGGIRIWATAAMANNRTCSANIQFATS